MLLVAPDAHVIQDVLMERGVVGHTTSEGRPVVSMD